MKKQFNSHDTVRLSTTREHKLRSICLNLRPLNESESEEFQQGPPLKLDSASFGGISQNRKYFFEITVFRKRTGNEIFSERAQYLDVI